MWERRCLPGDDAMYPCCPSVSFDIDNHPPHCCTSITALSSRIDCLSDWKVSQHDFPYEILGCTLPCATSTHSRRYRRFSSCGWKIDLRDARVSSFDNFCCLACNAASTSSSLCAFNLYRSVTSICWKSIHYSFFSRDNILKKKKTKVQNKFS